MDFKSDSTNNDEKFNNSKNYYKKNKKFQNNKKKNQKKHEKYSNKKQNENESQSSADNDLFSFNSVLSKVLTNQYKVKQDYANIDDKYRLILEKFRSKIGILDPILCLFEPNFSKIFDSVVSEFETDKIKNEIDN